MNSDFPRILTLLRKEKKISQKKAAEDLGIAQALLSHYEKGKRECGLDFLIKAADYYNVSTDYLLGRSAVSSGAIIAEEDISQSDIPEKARNLNADELASVFAKKLVVNSIDVIYSILAKTKNAVLMDKVHNVFSFTIYRVFRIIYKSNKNNDKNIFKIPEEKADQLIAAGESIAVADAISALPQQSDDCPVISRSDLEKEYGKNASVLLNTVMSCEKKLEKL